MRGIPEQFIQRLLGEGGTAGHCEMDLYYDYDSVCTAIDTEIYKRVSLEMLAEAGVKLYLNTMLVDAITSDHDAHMSTRNTVSCMGHGQAAGTAAALISRRGIDSRSLSYDVLRKALLEDDVYLEN